MSEFFITTSIAYCIGHSYVLWHLYRAFGLGRYLYILLPCFVLMGFYPLVFKLLPNNGILQIYFSWISKIWLPFVASIFFLFALYDFVRIILKIINQRKNNPLKFKISPKPLVVYILFLSILFYGYGLYEASSIRPVYLKIYSDKPNAEHKKLRIAFLADVHIGRWFGEGRVRKLVDCIIEQKPDLVLVGGDFTDVPIEGHQPELDLLKNITAQQGKFAILGNHEGYLGVDRALSFFKAADFVSLRRQELQKAGLTIVSVDDERVSSMEGSENNNPMPLLKGTDQLRFIILLDHRPRLRPERVGLFDLQLSGHTHGGQIWPANYLMHYIYKVPNGLSEHSSAQGKSSVFVTNGVGTGKIPIRFFTPPELVIIDIEFADS